MKWKFSAKFYVGVVILVSSFIIAKIAQVVFVIYYGDFFWKWFSVILYAATWPMLFVSVWWIGKESAQNIRKYFSYKHYRERAKEKLKRK